MKNNGKKIINICNIACIVLLLALIGLQFIPYWYGTSNEYWTPAEYAKLSDAEITAAAEASKDGVGPISLADACWFPVHDELTFITHAVILLLGGVCIFFCVKNWNSTFNCVPVLALAIIALVGYLAPVMTTGNLWIVHVVLCGLLAAVGVVLLCYQVQKWIRWFTEIDVIKT